ncbi:hypothetical protein DDE01_03100 [Desulfovibrio desulfuricans]|nr:hypothetical protein DDE01_03100 [Desulfovibrio desulfuricans]
MLHEWAACPRFHEVIPSGRGDRGIDIRGRKASLDEGEAAPSRFESTADGDHATGDSAFGHAEPHREKVQYALHMPDTGDITGACL